MRTLPDSTALRKARAEAYKAGQWSCPAPPVYSGNWSVEAWCNYVHFNDPNLTGFLPYTKP